MSKTYTFRNSRSWHKKTAFVIEAANYPHHSIARKFKLTTPPVRNLRAHLGHPDALWLVSRSSHRR